MQEISQQIARELNVQTRQVDATIELLDDGATVPFIARYRKEMTGALDDSQLRQLEDRLRYLRELQERRNTILASIQEQEKLTPALEAQVRAAETKSELEDLYLPYKPKRRTKGQIAIEAGLEPLADMLFEDPEKEPENVAQAFINADTHVPDTKSALDGARYILMERFSEDAALLRQLKNYLWDAGEVISRVVDGEKENGKKFLDYFDYREAISKIPSHRALALFRGRNEGILTINLGLPDHNPEDRSTPHPCEGRIAAHFGVVDKGRAGDRWLMDAVRWTWRVKLNLHIETELLGRLREQAEQVAIKVFAENLKDLLLAAPAGDKATMGLDPGLRTGVKVAVVDKTGKLVEHATIYPHAPKNQWDASIDQLAQMAKRHQVELLSIGNGTASRETDKLASDLIARHPELKLTRIMVSEAGASVYSASEFAAREFPDLDVTIRGAVSIARRLQDPLAELVKIEPKAIGVGQYQHDVSQVQLNRSLNSVIEDCVNAVGVDVNTASAPLLARVAGLSSSMAGNIVDFRDQNGPFKDRKTLKKVPRLGDKAFEQCAGFLRIRDGENPLDASAVHPESYPIVKRIADSRKLSIAELVGNATLVSGLAANDFVSEDTGELTIRDILTELSKPGRDPRPEFKFASFADGVETLKDLEAGMILEGSVTNVTHFGAFVDIGVHQDGLVHISALADRFVKDPREVVKAGDIVKVKVMEVDISRKRIGLSMRLNDTPGETASGTPSAANRGTAAKDRKASKKPTSSPGNAMGGAMAAAFKQAKK